MAIAKRIAIDWGTSNFRAFLLDATGHVIDQIQGAHGILSYQASEFPSVLRELLRAWLDADIPIIMSGMIGSRQGWQETDYMSCPFELKDLAASLVTIPDPDYTVQVVPGVSCEQAEQYDVMRGEETQLLGALLQHADERRVFCIPGTHSKWGLLNGQSLAYFKTYMTGELYTVLLKHSILGKGVMTEVPFDQRSFCQGLTAAKGQDSLLARLFSARTQLLQQQLSSQQVPAYLSGLLIGDEVLAATQAFQDQTIMVVGDHKLVEVYQLALTHYGLKSFAMDGKQTVVQGLSYLARGGK